MGTIAILAQLVGLSNSLTPIIAGLVSQFKTTETAFVAQIRADHPEYTEQQIDDEIVARALATATETKTIAGEDKSDRA
jgi:hypothetical protein